MAGGGLQVSGVAQQAQTLSYEENSKERPGLNVDGDGDIVFLGAKKSRGHSEVELSIRLQVLLSACLYLESAPVEHPLHGGTQVSTGGLKCEVPVCNLGHG